MQNDHTTNKQASKLPPIVRVILIVLPVIFISILGINLYLKAIKEPVKPLQQQPAGKYADILKKFSSPNIKDQMEAVNRLAELNDLNSTKLLVTLAGSEKLNADLMPVFMGALVSITDKSALAWLSSDGLKFPDPEIRRILTAVSPFLATPPSIDTLTGQFSDADEMVRFNTVKALEKTGTPESIAALEQGLMDASWTVREETIRALASRKTPDSHKLLIKNCDLFPVTGNEFRLLQDELTRNASAETISYIATESLFSTNPDIRLLSANIIGSIKYEGNAGELIERIFSFKPENDTVKSTQSLLWTASRLINNSSQTLQTKNAIDFFVRHISGQNEEIALSAAYAMSLLPARFRDTIPASQIPADWRIKSMIIAADNTQMPKSPDGISGIFSKRFESNPEQDAIAKGLFWLLRHQEPDGRWSCAKHNPYHEHVPLPAFTYEDEAVDPSVTGLAILSFLHSGYTHKYGPYQEPIRKALEYMISCQADDGQINIEKGHRHTRTCLSMGEDHGIVPVRYNHNIGTQALVEAYAMTKDDWLLPYAQKALDHSHNRTEETFKWSFYLEPTDIGPSSSYITALEAAKYTGLKVAPEDYQGAQRYLQKLTDPESGRIIHICPIPWCFGGYDSTSTGIFLRFLTGYEDKTGLQKKAIEWLMPHQPVWNVHFIIPKVAEDLTIVKDDILNYWHWYYCSLAYWNGGRDIKPEWNWAQEVDTQLKEHQRIGGDLDGSWDPEGAWCGVGGRVYSTTFSILTLEASNAYSK
ncbi:MAG: HEAT repeat domain-containing protein [Planctomycetes bacterium]|nr:HEAT repeat domain-containing protein [Planctomycetota bacterium]